MHPKQLKVYKIKAAFLEKRGWVTYYHYNNWINPNYISHNDKSIPSLGLRLMKLANMKITITKHYDKPACHR
jgi:hypothetical protein